MEKIWLFGASAKGKEALSILRDHFSICGFIDNDPQKQGSAFLDLPVVSLDTFITKTGTASIAICSQYLFEIMEQLISSEIRSFYVFEMKHGSTQSNGSLVPCDFTTYKDSLDEQSLAIFIHNASGSNTRALARFGNLEDTWHVKCAHEGQGDPEWYHMYMTSLNFVCTHDLVVPEGRNTIQLWHGFPLKGLNYMSRFQSDQHRRKHQKYWQRYNAIASYSATYTSLINACFGVSAEQYHITGMPRNDFLFHSDGKQIFKNVTDTQLDHKKLIAYMPTFRTTAFGQINGGENSALFNFPDFDLDELIRYLDRNNLKLLIKMHPYEVRGAQAMQRMRESDAFCIITDNMLSAAKIDFYELLNAVDLLITDYSSIYFDYLLLDRPIVFTPTDIVSYQDTRGFLMEPYEFWAPGPKCLNQKDLFSTIETELSHPKTHSHEREQVASIAHHFRDGNASQRVTDMINACIIS